MTRSEIAGLFGGFMLTLLGTCQTIFPKWLHHCILHYPQQCCESSNFYTFVNLVLSIFLLQSSQQSLLSYMKCRILQLLLCILVPPLTICPRKYRNQYRGIFLILLYLQSIVLYKCIIIYSIILLFMDIWFLSKIFKYS